MPRKDDSDSEDNQGAGAPENAEEEEEVPPTTFEALGVCGELCEACKGVQWGQPTEIQAASIPHLVKGKDVIGLAQTGSGKTGAFAIPILQSLLAKVSAFFALIIAPARELAIQIAETFDSLGSTIGLKTCVLVGGVDMMAQTVKLGKRPHVIIGTPGRIVDHLSNTKGFSLKGLKVLVLDEADKLLDMDFEQEINQILEVIPRVRQTMLFSATMTSKVKKLQRASLHKPVRVSVATKFTTVKTLRQQYVFCPQKYKETFLVYALNELSGSTSIVFVRTCDSCRRLTLILRNLGFGAVSIHGQMSQPKRLAALHKFKAAERSMLIATDVAARGLDIPDVALVVNFDVPTNSKDYVHRVGRTARAGRSGRSITFVTQYDVELYQKIETNIEMKLEEFPCPKEEVMVFHEKVGEAARMAARLVREADAKRKRNGKKRGTVDDDAADELLGNVGKMFRRR